MLDYVWLIPLFPAIGFLINGFFGRRLGKRSVSWVGLFRPRSLLSHVHPHLLRTHRKATLLSASLKKCSSIGSSQALSRR